MNKGMTHEDFVFIARNRRPFIAIEGSHSGHCCFKGSVIMVSEDYVLPDNDEDIEGDIICETFDFNDAVSIATIQNEIWRNSMDDLSDEL